MNDIAQQAAFFWLGADGELEDLTEKDFATRILDHQDRERAWKNVDIAYTSNEGDYGEYSDWAE